MVAHGLMSAQSSGTKTSSKALTIESRNHLQQFLSQLLAEETGYRDADKDAWVTSIVLARFGSVRFFPLFGRTANRTFGLVQQFPRT